MLDDISMSDNFALFAQSFFYLLRRLRSFSARAITLFLKNIIIAHWAWLIIQKFIKKLMCYKIISKQFNWI